jgi:membrane associated rhomboid family serine protease
MMGRAVDKSFFVAQVDHRMHERIPAPHPYFEPIKRPVAWVTWLLVGSTVAVFLLQLWAQRIYGKDVLGDALACSPQSFDEHRYWTLLTYAWAHALAMFDDPGLFWLHIASNMILLVCVGPMVEEILGHMRYLLLYLGGAIVSAITWLAFNSDLQAGIIGASGAVFALIVAAGTAMPRQRITVFLLFFPVPMRMGVLAAAFCGVEVAQICFGWMTEVAHSAHLGGAAFGFVYVMALRLISRRKHLSN